MVANPERLGVHLGTLATYSYSPKSLAGGRSGPLATLTYSPQSTASVQTMEFIMNSSKSLIATSVLTLLAGTNLAYAAASYGFDRKIFTGAQCQPAIGAQMSDFAVNVDGIRNLATTARYITCIIPIDTDATINQLDSDSSTADGPFYLSMTFDYSQVPATGTYTTDCTFVNRTFSTQATTAFSVTSGRVLGSLVPTYPGNVAAADGVNTFTFNSYSFNCLLPSKVKLVHIYYSEETATDGYSYTP